MKWHPLRYLQRISTGLVGGSFLPGKREGVPRLLGDRRALPAGRAAQVDVGQNFGAKIPS